MSPQASRPAAPARSPILAAVGISLAIGLGTVLGTTDTATLADVATGKWLTRSFTETQQAHTVAIAALEQNLGSVTREMDFVATRVGASVARSEERTYDRLALLDAELAALKSKIAGLQGVRPGTPVASEGSDIIGLRTSLHDLSAAHNSAVAALTKRLDRIEVKVGLASDVPPASGPRVHKARTVAKLKKPTAAAPFEMDPFSATGRPENGHLFNVKPLSRQDAQLRITRLRD
jgi:hypothetical protein